MTIFPSDGRPPRVDRTDLSPNAKRVEVSDPTLAAFHAPRDEPVPTYDHVMIDIETLSLSKHNALILSVGMVEFTPEPLEAPRFGNRALIIPNIEQQLLLGREVSKGTQKFWREQKPEASAHWAVYGGERASIRTMCKLIKTFCANSSRVWANGTQFDLTNLEVINEQLGAESVGDLWHYQAPRDMRTFCRENPTTRLVPIGDALDIPGVPHEPVYDCISQAWKVWSHWPQA